jgi:hypothetical protein
MISGIRNSISNKTFKYILWGAIIAIPGGTLLVGLLDRSASKDSDTVALVNGYEISRTEFREKVRELEELMRHDWYRLIAPGALDNPMDQALSTLVQEKVLISTADKLGLKQPSEDYIAAKLDDSKSRILPDYLYDSLGNLDKERLALFLRKQGITLSDFEDRLENMYKQQFTMALLQSAAYSPQASFNRSRLRTSNDQVFSTIFLDLNDYIKKSREKNSSQNKESEKAFFKQQNNLAKRYWAPEKRSATVWEFTPKGYNTTVSEKEIKNRYETNKQKFGDKQLKDVSKEIAETLKKEKFVARFTMDARRVVAEALQDPQVFAEFAKKHGGIMLQMPLQNFQPSSPVSKKLFDLSKPGKAGFVAGASKGQMVLYDSVVASYEPKFEDVADQVEADYHAEKAITQLRADLKSIREDLATKNPEEIVKKWNIQPVDRSFKSSDKVAWEKADKEGLPVSRMKNMIHAGHDIEHIDPQGGYLVKLKAITPFVSDKAEADSQALWKQETYLFAPAFIASLQNNATIEYNKSTTT